MREEYDIENLNPRRNPYTNRLKRQVTINLNESVIEYFKKMSEQTGLPYQTLIDPYLTDCAANNQQLQMKGFSVSRTCEKEGGRDTIIHQKQQRDWEE